jgi:hypothetical protein
MHVVETNLNNPPIAAKKQKSEVIQKDQSVFAKRASLKKHATGGVTVGER